MIPMLRVRARGNSRMSGVPFLCCTDFGSAAITWSFVEGPRSMVPYGYPLETGDGRAVRPAGGCGTGPLGSEPGYRSVPTSVVEAACVNSSMPSPSSPAVVRERLIGLGHLVEVVAPLHRRPNPIGGVE